MAKAIRQQAATAEQVAATSADAFVADQMKTFVGAGLAQHVQRRQARRAGDRIAGERPAQKTIAPRPFCWGSANCRSSPWPTIAETGYPPPITLP